MKSLLSHRRRERNSVTRFVGRRDTIISFDVIKTLSQLTYGPTTLSLTLFTAALSASVRDPHIGLLSLGYEPPSIEDDPKQRTFPDPGSVHGLRGSCTFYTLPFS